MSAPGLSPAERLVLSRERLRIAMAHPSTTPQGPGPSGPGTGLLDLLKSAIPSASLLIDTLGAWWERHPLHTTGLLAGGLAQSVLRPLAQRHPLAMVAGAVALGAVLVFSRPWRWAFKPPMLSALGPALLSSLLASATVQSWIATALAKESPDVTTHR